MKKPKYPTNREIIQLNKNLARETIEAINSGKIKSRYEMHGKEILVLLDKLWQKHSHMRLGQLLENWVFIDGNRGDKTSCALYYQEDEKTIKRIKGQKKYLQKLKRNR